MNNYFFKWILHLSVKEREDFLEKICPPNGLSVTWYAILDKTVKLINRRTKFLKSFPSERAAEDGWTALRHEIAEAIYKNTDKASITKITKEFTKNKKALESFIIECELKNDKLLKQQLLFKAAQRRNFLDATFKGLDIREKENEAQKLRTTDYLFERYEVEYLRFFRPDVEKNKPKSRHRKKVYDPTKAQQAIWNHQNILVLTMKIRMACQLKFWQKGKIKVEFKNYNNEEIEYIRNGILSYSKEEAVAAHFYLALFDLLFKGSLSDYEIVKERFIDLIDIFTIEEQGSIYALFLNHLTYLICSNDERKDIYKAYRKLSKFALDSIFSSFNYISDHAFINIFTSAIQDDAVFIDELLTKYIKVVPPQYAKTVRDICEIKYLFYLKGIENYKKCQAISANIAGDNLGHIVQARTFEIMAEYELQLLDSLNEDNYNTTKLAINFKRSINEAEKLYRLYAPDSKEMMLNFLNVIIAINSHNEKEALKLFNKAGYNIQSRSWLLEKIKQL